MRELNEVNARVAQIAWGKINRPMEPERLIGFLAERADSGLALPSSSE